MQLFLLVSLAFAATIVSAQEHEHREHENRDHQATLPDYLIKRAQGIIHFAEMELHRHHQEGRHHLTKALESEIEKVRHLERELMTLEKERHMDIHHVHEVEEKLLHHENILSEELMKIMHAHQREGHEKGEHERREREHQGHDHTKQQNILPAVLIKRARVIIENAEKDLHRHHSGGLQHLTKEAEHEVQAVRHLERALLALEQHKHMEGSHVHEVEEKLLHHENTLLAMMHKIEDSGRKEREGREGHENREHEKKNEGEDELLGHDE